MTFKTSRRSFLKQLAVVGAGSVAATWVAGCAPEPTPTPKPAPAAEKPAEPTKAPEPVEEKITLRYMERAGLLGDFMRHASREYEKANPNITIKNESAGWGDLANKVPTMVAAGTMADLAFQHGAYMLPLLGKKGAWLDMTPAADKDNHDFDIYYQWALDTCRLGPADELIAMPMGVNYGQNEMHWNVEMIDEMGLDQPDNKMSKQELLEWLIKVQEKMPEGGYATDMGFSNHYTAECHARSWGGYVIGPERKTLGLMMPETQEAYKFGWDLVNTYKIVPGRDEIQESTTNMFMAGAMASYFNVSANVWVGFNEAIAGAWTLGHCTWPHAEGEGWGGVPSADATVIYGETKYPDESWGLAKMLSSFEISKWTALSDSHMTPGAVIEAWHDPEVWEACPPYKNCAEAWDTLTPEQFGSMGVPYNTRRKEFDDLHDNEWQKMLYGDMEMNEANMQTLADSLQEVMDKPVP